MQRVNQRISPYPMPEAPDEEPERDGLIPGDTLRLRSATVVQGRETGYQYKLDKPLTVKRPTPEGHYLDTVEILDPVDKNDLTFTAGQRLRNVRLDVVGFSTIGRPNPDDATTTVAVKTAGPAPKQKEWVF